MKRNPGSPDPVLTSLALRFALHQFRRRDPAKAARVEAEIAKANALATAGEQLKAWSLLARDPGRPLRAQFMETSGAGAFVAYVRVWSRLSNTPREHWRATIEKMLSHEIRRRPGAKQKLLADLAAKKSLERITLGALAAAGWGTTADNVRTTLKRHPAGALLFCKGRVRLDAPRT